VLDEFRLCCAPGDTMGNEARSVLVCAVTAAVVGLTSAELVVNGGFETPILLGIMQNTLPVGDAGLTGWTITSGDVTVKSNGFQAGILAPEGVQYVDLCGSQPGAISQQLSVSSGQAYVLTFSLWGDFTDVALSGWSRTLSLTLGASSRTITVDATQTSWTAYSVPYFATATGTIQLTLAGVGCTIWGPQIDAVSFSLTSSPAPTSTTAATPSVTAAATSSCSGTPSATQSASPSVSFSPSALRLAACTTCGNTTFRYTGSFQYVNLTAPALAGATFLEVHLWGAAGGGSYGPGGAGAYLTGLLPLSRVSGPLLRVIVGAAVDTPSEATGGGGGRIAATSGFTTAGGGRSAIQQLAPDGVSWVDVVSAGGGGGAPCNTIAGPGSAGLAALSSGRGGQSNPDLLYDPGATPQCLVGEPFRGQDIFNTSLWCLGAGGGGFCGGLVSAGPYQPNGGGSSQVGPLTCAWGADGINGLPFDRSAYYVPGTAGSGVWLSGQPGSVTVVPLTSAAAANLQFGCGAYATQAPPTRSSTPSVSGSSSASLTGTGTGTPSPSVTASGSVTASSSLTASSSITGSQSGEST